MQVRLGTEVIAKRAWDALKAFVNPTIRDFLALLVERRVVRRLKPVSA
ncbi:MAG: three-helix bundle dimerization domain-containing protein [Propionibacteriaceae bacterium]